MATGYQAIDWSSVRSVPSALHAFFAQHDFRDVMLAWLVSFPLVHDLLAQLPPGIFFAVVTCACALFALVLAVAVLGVKFLWALATAKPIPNDEPKYVSTQLSLRFRLNFCIGDVMLSYLFRV